MGQGSWAAAKERLKKTGACIIYYWQLPNELPHSLCEDGLTADQCSTRAEKVQSIIMKYQASKWIQFKRQWFKDQKCPAR